METSQQFHLPLKIKTLRRLAVMSAALFVLAFALPVYSLTLDNGQQALLYVMSMHLGLFILSQWASFECKVIEYQVKLYSVTPVADGRAHYYRQVIHGLPLITAAASVISLLILI